jgi:glycosyltransferase involved in cell wall biosynthesis
MENQIKVIIFGPSEKFLSGITYYTSRLSIALAEPGEVTAILFNNMLPERLFPGWKRVGKPLSSLYPKEKVKINKILDWYNPLTWIRGYGIARKGNVIIFEWWTSSVAFIYLFIAALNCKRIPLIIEYHEVVDPLENSNVFFRLYSRVSGHLLRRFATNFVVHSNVDKELIEKSYHIRKERIELIEHGLYDYYPIIDKNYVKSNLNIEEENIILFFGLLRPYKGIKYLIHAFNSLDIELINHSRLLIVGEAWEDRESIILAENSLYKEKITIVNRYVSDEEIPLFFSAADVLVLPYLRASQSGVAHIGMSYGLPIIASNIGSFIESLSKYQGTIFINPEDGEAFKKALTDVLTDKRTYSPPESLKWDTITQKWLDIFNKTRIKDTSKW